MLEDNPYHASVGTVRYLYPLSTLLSNTLFRGQVHTGVEFVLKHAISAVMDTFSTAIISLNAGSQRSQDLNGPC